mmetsp:Transcript_75191/g.118798  ORF Transcript_75191/g.118798 Transcript_75191/m.118798 type:complete len:221 (-) Transcript_75191:842-1504(-)
MLQIFEWFLVYFRVQHIMDCIHLCFPVLLIHVALFLHLPYSITGLLDVDFMRGALDSQTVHFFTELKNVTFVLSQATLDTTHSKIQCAQPARSFGTAELSLLLDRSDLFECFLLLLANVVFQSRFSVGNIAFQIASNHCDFVEAVAQRILCCMETFLRCCQVLVCEVDSAIECINSLIGIACDFRLRFLEVCFHCGDIMSNSGQYLIYFTAPCVHIQAKR